MVARFVYLVEVPCHILDPSPPWGHEPARPFRHSRNGGSPPLSAANRTSVPLYWTHAGSAREITHILDLRPAFERMRHDGTVTASPRRARMTGQQRREQLLRIGRALFAEKGFDGTSVEEIAARAKVSKPVVYEHFGGKEGLYAVIVDREVDTLLGALTTALTSGRHPRITVEAAALALLDYIDERTDGFRILVRDSPVAQATGTFSSLIGDVASQVEHILAEQFDRRGMDVDAAPMYAQMLVGMIALTGQWWLEERSPSKEIVAAHLVNLAWNGLQGMEAEPTLSRTWRLSRPRTQDSSPE